MRAISFLFLIGIIANSADAAPTQFTEHAPAEHFADAFDSDSSEVDEPVGNSLTQMSPAKAIQIMHSVSKLKKSSLGKVAKLLSQETSASTSPTHAQKLETTIAKKSELVAKLDEIMRQLKTDFASHSTTAEAEATKITNAKFGIADNQYKPLVTGAKKWCASRVAQKGKGAAIAGKKSAEAEAKAVAITSPTKWETAAANFEVSYEKGTAYAAVEFGAAAAFQAQFKNARESYWKKKKAHFEAKEAHTTAISSANRDGAAFKATINELASAIAKQCEDFGRVAAKKIIVDFNTANDKRASVYRLLDLVKCHVGNLGVNGAPTCTAKPTSDFKKGLFTDIVVPTITCPDEARLRTEIRTKKANLNFHFKGSASSPGIKADGSFVADQGWTPTTEACTKVDSHAETLFGKAYPYVWAHLDQSCTQACHKYGDQECDEAKLRKINADLVGSEGRKRFNEYIKNTNLSGKASIHCNKFINKGPNIHHSQVFQYSQAENPGYINTWPQIGGPTGPNKPGGKHCGYGTGSFSKSTCDASIPCILKQKPGQTYNYCAPPAKPAAENWLGAGVRFCACKEKA